jgi:nitrate/TMAO reductase-like tetraheme cytochrome c subunit
VEKDAMKNFLAIRKHRSWLVFSAFFCISVLVGGVLAIAKPVTAAPVAVPANQAQGYAGSQSCAQCHQNIIDAWEGTRHAQAFSAPIFQRDWTELGSQVSCLECHTTGYDAGTGKYAEAGVTCEACHGPFQPTHPNTPMPITPNADLCGNCHKTTTDEWRASVHAQVGIQCQDCHNPHSQTPKAASVTALCTTCHPEPGNSFTHSTHANAGLECSNCHMYTSPRANDPIMGLVPTGHTFSVGSDACIACHQDTVHTRDEIVKLTGEVAQLETADTTTLEQQVQSQQQQISDLKAQSTNRLYIGLVQGAIVGLLTGGAAAWVVSRGIHVVEINEAEKKDDEQKENKY